MAEIDRGVEIWGVQVTKTPRPAGYCPTAAATSSQAVESAIFNTLTWLGHSSFKLRTRGAKSVQ